MNLQLNKWYVLYVRSRQEKKVHDLLVENDIETFLPIIETVRTWSDRKKKIKVPLFTSYVFVKIKSAMDHHKSLSINGACAYISFGGQYAVVQDHEIEMIKLLIDTEKKIQLSSFEKFPEKGEIRTIQRGPLQGIDCEIINVNNQNNIIVRMKSIRQNIVVKIPMSYLYDLPKAV